MIYKKLTWAEYSEARKDALREIGQAEQHKKDLEKWCE
jgi:hypothetical protein